MCCPLFSTFVHHSKLILRSLNPPRTRLTFNNQIIGRDFLGTNVTVSPNNRKSTCLFLLFQDTNRRRGTKYISIWNRNHLNAIIYKASFISKLKWLTLIRAVDSVCEVVYITCIRRYNYKNVFTFLNSINACKLVLHTFSDFELLRH